MNIYKHIVFNPKLGVSPLSQLLSKFDQSVWALHSIVPVTEYEWVAIFEAWDGEKTEDNVFGRKPLVAQPESLNSEFKSIN